MKPQSYLSELAEGYFKECAQILEDRGIADDSYNVELSILANEYAKYEEASKKVNEVGPYVTFSTGAQQVAPWFTVQKDSIANILKLGAKFGFNPTDFDKIKKSMPAKPQEEELEPEWA